MQATALSRTVRIMGTTHVIDRYNAGIDIRADPRSDISR